MKTGWDLLVAGDFADALRAFRREYASGDGGEYNIGIAHLFLRDFRGELTLWNILWSIRRTAARHLTPSPVSHPGASTSGNALLSIGSRVLRVHMGIHMTFPCC